MKSFALSLCLCACATAVFAQQAAPTEFPPDATDVSKEALSHYVTGKVLRAMPADGNGWRLDFRSGGHYFVNTDRGYNGKGTWRVEEGKLCTESPRTPASCNEVKLKSDVLYLKRDSGEVVALKVQ